MPMSSEIALKVENLSKFYHIYDTPRSRLKQFTLPFVQRIFGRQPQQFYREFWALKDVSFDVKKRETVGIIGCNGSGKSTLLQLICGTLNPSSGRIESNGRIAALLELGSGFNPEFSGRENVYMYSALLGLSKEDVDRRFDDIAAFADIGDFIEQPIKSYSNGMVVRLAFAVVAHVDAEILAIDEALAVGDAVFTQKCMRFLREFKEVGTLVFVSHDLGSVLNLCERAIWLDKGHLKQIGDAKAIAESYLQHTLQEAYGQAAKLQAIEAAGSTEAGAYVKANNDLPMDIDETSAINCGASVSVIRNLNASKGWKTDVGEILSVRLEHLVAPSYEVFRGGEMVRMTITAKAHAEIDKPIIGFLVRDRLGQDLFGENTLTFTDINPRPIKAGSSFSGEFVFRLPMLPNGKYSVVASLANGDMYSNVQHHWLHDALIMNVSSSKVRWGLIGIGVEKIDLKSLL